MPPSSAPIAVRARVADEAWRPLLEEGRVAEAVVDTVFERSLNIAFDGGLLTVLGQSGRRAPGAMLTSLPGVRGVHAGTALERVEETLVIGRLRIDCSRVEFFSSRVEPLEGPISATPADLEALPSAYARPGSFLPGTDETPFEDALSSRLAGARSSFQDAFRRDLRAAGHRLLEEASASRSEDQPDGQALALAISELVGLGRGLTPSGDDYLVGALATLALAPGQRASVARERLASRVRARAVGTGEHATTTAVSRHFLLGACRREFHCDLADAARVLLTGAGDASGPLARTAGIGSTSGTDALFGLVDTLRILIE